jgi:hypothetical protein
MSTDTTQSVVTEERTWRGSWVAGAVGGVVGAAAFGLLMTLLGNGGVIAVAIPNMYVVEATPASPALPVGWAIHLFHGAVIGLGFAGLLRLGPISRFAGEPAGLPTLAVFYGVGVWVLLGAIVMPIWLTAVGFPGAPPLPNLSLGSLVGHVLYSAVLAGVYAVLAS